VSFANLIEIHLKNLRKGIAACLSLSAMDYLTFPTFVTTLKKEYRFLKYLKKSLAKHI